MLFCTKCENEFSDNTTVCPECGNELTEISKEPKEPVFLNSLSDANLADEFMSYLKTFDIYAVKRISAKSNTDDDLIGYDVFVFEENVEEALALYDQFKTSDIIETDITLNENYFEENPALEYDAELDKKEHPVEYIYREPVDKKLVLKIFIAILLAPVVGFGLCYLFLNFILPIFTGG